MGIQRYDVGFTRIGPAGLRGYGLVPDENGIAVKHAAHVAHTAALVQALRSVRSGVVLMVPEPQKSGFLKIIDAALEGQP